MANTYPTSDIPLGSTAAKVLYNNASNMDDAMNSLGPAWTDRFNRLRKTFAGMEMDFQDFLVQSGYQYVGADYIDGVPGLTFTARNQYTVRMGLAYRLSPSAPIPYVTTGVWATDQTNFVAFELDSALRQDLAVDDNVMKGAYLSGYRGRTVGGRLDDTVNVLDFGADPTGLTDSLAAFIEARDKLLIDSDYRGGRLLIPRGYYKMSGNFQLLEYAPGQVINIYIEGDGVQNTVLDFATAPVGTDGVSFIGGSQAGIRGLTIQNAKRNGLVFDDVAQWSAEELRIQACVQDGFYTINSFLCTMTNIWSFGHGRNAFTLAGNHTSFVVTKCWGMLSERGWAINGITYSSLISCAADQNTLDGYAGSNIRGVTFFNCGHENNGTNGMLFSTSTASVTNVAIPAEYENIHQLQLIGCQGYFNNMTTPGAFAAFMSVLTADGRPAEITMIGCGSKRSNASDAAMVLNGASGAISYSSKGDFHDGTLVTAGTVLPLGYLEASRSSGTPVALSTVVAQNVTSIALPLGDWEINGMVVYYPTGTTSVTEYHAGISTVPNTEGDDQTLIVQGRGFTRIHPGSFNILSPTVRIRSDGTVVAYLIALSVFTASTLTAAGKMTARKL